MLQDLQLENDHIILRHLGLEDNRAVYSFLSDRDSCFLREGLAMFFDRSWWGIANWEWSAYFKEKQIEKSITELIADAAFYEVDCSISYPIAGAFTEYLVCRYGLEKYIGFYKCPDTDFGPWAVRTFGKSLEELDADFWQYIERDFPDLGLENQMEKLRVEKLNLFGE